MQIVIQPGMTFYTLSQVFGIPLNLLMASNPTQDPFNLQEGQIIKIPGYSTTTHTVRENDTLFQLASEYRVPLNQLLVSNPENPDRLEIGQRISVPQPITERS